MPFKKNTMDHIVLNTDARMPVIGLGTWKASSEKVEPAVEYALTECGYRHVDCAAIYYEQFSQRVQYVID